MNWLLEERSHADREGRGRNFFRVWHPMVRAKSSAAAGQARRQSQQLLVLREMTDEKTGWGKNVNFPVVVCAVCVPTNNVMFFLVYCTMFTHIVREIVPLCALPCIVSWCAHRTKKHGKVHVPLRLLYTTVCTVVRKCCIPITQYSAMGAARNHLWWHT